MILSCGHDAVGFLVKCPVTTISFWQSCLLYVVDAWVETSIPLIAVTVGWLPVDTDAMSSNLLFVSVSQ